MPYSYSIDEEHYEGNFLSRDEAAATGFADNPDYDTLWTGQKVKIEAIDLVNADYLLEDVSERAWDEFGEYTENWLDDKWKEGHQNQIAELEKTIADWIDKHAPINFFTVDNIRQFQRGQEPIN
jgi:hypothetical protein